MSGPPHVRGPSGEASFPPPDLAVMKVPSEVVPAGTPLYRIHQTAYGPIFYGPGPTEPPTYRFDSASGAFGVLYVSLTPAGAMLETLVRNPQFDFVDRVEIAKRSRTDLTCARDLKLAKLYGSGLSPLGLKADISSGPYAPCGAWADGLQAHPDDFDGLLYHSRHDPLQICIALFERATDPLPLAITAQVPLLDNPVWIEAELGAYQKKIL